MVCSVIYDSDFQLFRPDRHWRDLISRNAHLVHQNWHRMSFTLHPTRCVFLIPSPKLGDRNTQLVGDKSYQTTNHGKSFIYVYLRTYFPPTIHLIFRSYMFKSLLRRLEFFHAVEISPHIPFLVVIGLQFFSLPPSPYEWNMHILKREVKTIIQANHQPLYLKLAT
jgi:hypothetical protein